jgi:hypothetical protein
VKQWLPPEEKQADRNSIKEKKIVSYSKTPLIG